MKAGHESGVDEAWVKVGGAIEQASPPLGSVAELLRERDSPLLLAGSFAASRTLRDLSFPRLAEHLGATTITVMRSDAGIFPGARRHRPDGVDVALSTVLQLAGGPEAKRYYVYAHPFHFLAPCLSEPDEIRRLLPEPTEAACWLSGPGAMTPIHWDGSDNVLVQVNGAKRVWVWSPSDYQNLSIYPVPEAKERHSDIDLRQAEPERFPRFAAARALVAKLTPGDALYLPTGWMHAIETTSPSLSLSHRWTAQAIQHARKALSLERFLGLVPSAARLQQLASQVELRPSLQALFLALQANNSLFPTLLGNSSPPARRETGSASTT